MLCTVRQTRTTRMLYSLTTLVVIFAMLLANAASVSAQTPPALPSSFYGLVRISDMTVTVGTPVEVFLNGTLATTTQVTTYQTDLVYSVNVPGQTTNQNHPVLFKIAGRTVARGSWATGTNVQLDFHPPTASVSGGPVNEGAPVTLTASSTDAGDDVASYAFDCNNDGAYETAVPAGETSAACPAFADDGTYTVGVKAVDAQAGEGTATTTVTVNNVAPTLTISGAATVAEGSTYTLNLASTDPGADTIEQWAITWGDVWVDPVSGNPASVSHVYTQGPNNFTISATAMDEDGTYSSNTFAVAVTNVAPVVSAGADATVAEGSAFTQSGAFTDPGADNWTGAVNYGDGSGDQVLALSAKTFNLSHVYGQNGAYTVTVSVYDGTVTSTDTVTVTVSNVAPAFEAGGSANLNQGETLARSLSFTDPGADTWAVSVNYGDGSAVANPTVTDKAFDLSHTYLAVGTHTVSVAVNDGVATTTDSFTVMVNNVAPTATFNAPASVAEGSPIGISLSGVIDPGSSLETYLFAFDCGSGYGAWGASASAACPTTDDGSRTVRGKVRDNNGGEADYSATVTITDVLPTAVSAGGPYAAASGAVVNLTGSATCLAVDACAFAWDLDNNGSFETSGLTASNTWYTVGAYTVQFRATDNDGNAVTASAQVNITALTHAITLQPGWNLVSFNLRPTDTSAAAVLSSIAGRYDLVYVWDPSFAGNWRSLDNNPASPDSLTTLNETMGVWIHVTGATTATLNVTGSLPVSTTITLASGWNLVGYPAATARALPGAISGTGVTRVFNYDAADTADPWAVFDASASPWSNDLTQLSAGWGYWMYNGGAPSTWTVNYQ